ncbi:hypothetical protein GGTG_03421 [Gaeumannomyces tritici R3-111a-1]|uniref:Uncharacterized protein n=1 Tax=Gaeumannomyces tritici (strain R3-111a-1) TaxID=644352 RepID=J3NQ64_GAET3|nr:hypothetical protein GGTG_03421 [Gaeumannomyces tritici R3-111a-1]EJT78320.1 hypothetical protein GGTG_03421 [Gaeumannomyces tritici R3-111a-1]
MAIIPINPVCFWFPLGSAWPAFPATNPGLSHSVQGPTRPGLRVLVSCKPAWDHVYLDKCGGGPAFRYHLLGCRCLSPLFICLLFRPDSLDTGRPRCSPTPTLWFDLLSGEVHLDRL